MACPKISGCPLFPQFSMESSLRVWTNSYCEGAFQRCERYRCAMSGAAVPANLLPNGKLLDGSRGRVRAEDFS